jgi:hypothetical protein
MPHGLAAQEVTKLRRSLNRHPSVRTAYLARRETKLFADKPEYVLAIERRTSPLDDTPKAGWRLLASLRAQIEPRCAAVILGWGSRSLRSRIAKACPEPIFSAGQEAAAVIGRTV